MSIFDRNKNLEPGTVVYFLPNSRIGEEPVSGTIREAVEFEDGAVQYYLINMVVPGLGDTYLDLRTNMQIYLNKDDVPTLESIFGDDE